MRETSSFKGNVVIVDQNRVAFLYNIFTQTISLLETVENEKLQHALQLRDGTLLLFATGSVYSHAMLYNRVGCILQETFVPKHAKTSSAIELANGTILFHDSMGYLYEYHRSNNLITKRETPMKLFHMMRLQDGRIVTTPIETGKRIHVHDPSYNIIASYEDPDAFAITEYKPGILMYTETDRRCRLLIFSVDSGESQLYMTTELPGVENILCLENGRIVLIGYKRLHIIHNRITVERIEVFSSFCEKLAPNIIAYGKTIDTLCIHNTTTGEVQDYTVPKYYQILKFVFE
jgi:hypothetical protein